MEWEKADKREQMSDKEPLECHRETDIKMSLNQPLPCKKTTQAANVKDHQWSMALMVRGGLGYNGKGV